MKVKFFGPHPGFAGAAIPLPGAIKAAIDALDGLEMDLAEGLERINKAIWAARVRAELEIKDKNLAQLGHGSIALWMPKKIEVGTIVTEPTHLFRLIGFKPIS